MFSWDNRDTGGAVWSIDRTDQGKAYPLEPSVVRQLQAQWREGFSRAETGDASAASVQQALEGLHEAHRWIACGCRPDVRPVIYVIRLASGRYALRRSFDHGEHAPQCSFHWEEGAQAGRSLLVRTRRRQQSDAAYVPDFLLFRPEPEVGVQGARGAHVRSGGSPDAGYPLRQRLEWLAAHAGCVEIHPLSRHGVQEQMRLLRECARSVPLIDDLTLADVFWTHEQWHFSGWASRAAQALLKERWPRRLPMQGYLAVLVRSVTGNRLETLTGTLTVHGRVEMLAKHGPLLALVALRWDEAHARFDAASACVVARPQRGVVPLASEGLREMAGLLQWAARREERQSKRRFHIRRVLGGGAEQPDFVVTCGEREFGALMVTSPEDLPGKQAAAEALMAQGMSVELYAPAACNGDAGEAARLLARGFFAWAATL